MKAIHLPSAIIGSISVKAKNQGLSFRVTTPELTDTEKVAFMELQDSVVDMLIQPSDSEFPVIVEVKSEVDKKTPSQRLRGVLYILFTQNSEGYANFNTYYLTKMEGIIEHLKGRIE